MKKIKSGKLQTKEFGGELLSGKRKTQRPLEFDKTTHLVLRLKDTVPNLFNPRDIILRKGIFKLASECGIKVYQMVLNHTHVHLLLKIPDRESYIKIIRLLTSKMVSYFTKKHKIRFKNIFTHRPFTRIIQWGKDFKGVIEYFIKNENESGVAQVERSIGKKQKINIDQLELSFSLNFNTV